MLVFTRNDFLGNSAALAAMDYAGWDPDRTPYAFPVRAGDGGVRLRPPDPDYAASALPWALAEFRRRADRDGASGSSCTTCRVRRAARTDSCTRSPARSASP